MAKAPSGGGRRSDLKVRVKTSKGRKIGSTLWLQRQLNDPYVARAKAEGYRSRAAYKLLELDERYKLLHRGQRVVDLGEPGDVLLALPGQARGVPGHQRGDGNGQRVDGG